MKSLIKKLNKYTGDICFSARNTDDQCTIFECKRNGEVLHTISSRDINNICVADEKSYYISTNNSGYIGLFSEGILQEDYIYTP